MINQTKLLALFILSAVLNKGVAQNGMLSGVITDEKRNLLDFASIILLKLPDSSQIAAATSNEKGEFVFSNLYKGEYMIAAFLVGYNKTYSGKLVCGGYSGQQISLTMKSNNIETQEVTVQGQKPLVRQEPDRMIVDVESQVTGSGLNAQDLLKRSPGITIDKDGKINVKGRSGVMVMLDDKPLYMSEIQLANLLKSIPSDQIKEIEIITSPSAKYDAVGSAGIINIRLKKGAYEGLTGSWTSSLGQGKYYKANAGANISYKKKKLALNTGYQYNNKKDFEDDFTNRTYTERENEIESLNSNVLYTYSEQSHNILLNGQYKIKKNLATFDLNQSYLEALGSSLGSAQLLKTNNELKSVSINREKPHGQSLNLSAGAGYQIKLDTNGTLLTISGSYNRNLRYGEKILKIQSLDSNNIDMNIPYQFSMKNFRIFNQYSAKVDFTKVIFNKIKLESGLKANVTTNDNKADIKITENYSQQNAGDHFFYKENVFAAYVMLKKNYIKWTLQGGIRIEHTGIFGHQYVVYNIFTRSYTNLFPSGNISYSLTKKTSCTLLYSRRVKRPEAYHLNPILAMQDQYTYWGGNPNLLAQYSDNLELAYSILNGMVINTLGYSHNSNHISYVLLTEKDGLKTRSSFLNMKRKDNIGISIALNTPVNQWWSTSNFANVFYTKFEGGPGYENIGYKQTGWTVNSTQTVKLYKELTFEISGSYEAPKAQNAFGYNLETWQANLGVSKKIWGGKGLFKVAASDMFWTARWATRSIISNSIIVSQDKSDTRILMFTFSYKFGNKANIIQQ